MDFSDIAIHPLLAGRAIGFRFRYGEYAGGSALEASKLGGGGGGFNLGSLNWGSFSYVGSALKAFGAYQAGKAQAAGYKHERQRATFAAGEVERASRYDSWRMALNRRQALGSQRATYAALGLSTTEGTAIDNLAEAAKMLTLDKLMMQRGAKIEAQQHREDAKFYRKAEKAAKKSGTLSAISSFL